VGDQGTLRMTTCANERCGKPVSGRRSDALYCSRGCSNITRQRLFAQRHDRRSNAQWHDYFYGPRGTITALLGNARDRAARADLPFSLTREWLAERLDQGTCEVTGLSLVREARGNSRAHPFAPSIDRIKPSDGYIPENCRLVCFIFNQARSDFGDDTLLTMALALVERSSPRLGGLTA
jgi:hypothetical protein